MLGAFQYHILALIRQHQDLHKRPDADLLLRKVTEANSAASKMDKEFGKQVRAAIKERRDLLAKEEEDKRLAVELAQRHAELEATKVFDIDGSPLLTLSATSQLKLRP